MKGAEMALGAFATINTSSAMIVNNHKHARGERRDFFDAKRDGRQDGRSYLALGRAHIQCCAHHIVLHTLILSPPAITPEMQTGAKGWQPEPSLPYSGGERGCGAMVAKLNMFNYIIIIIITTTPAYARTCADTSAIAPAALLRIIARRETVVSGHEIRKSCFAIIISCPEINI